MQMACNGQGVTYLHRITLALSTMCAVFTAVFTAVFNAVFNKDVPGFITTVMCGLLQASMLRIPM
jgi:hypothetical protein